MKCILPAWAFNSSLLWYKLQSLSCPQIPSRHHFKGPTVILLGIFPDVYRLWEWQISFILYVYKYINNCKFLVAKLSVIVSMECVCVCLCTYGFNIILGCLYLYQSTWLGWIIGSFCSLYNPLWSDFAHKNLKCSILVTRLPLQVVDGIMQGNEP